MSLLWPRRPTAARAASRIGPAMVAVTLSACGSTGAPAASPTVTPTTPAPLTGTASPSPERVAGGFLESVACTSVSNCWAVGNTKLNESGSGQPIVEHSGGAAWTRETTDLRASSVSLNAVACSPTGGCWLVGWTGATSSSPLIAHDDGAGWSPVSSPALPSGQLQGVTCVASNDCWAVGASFAGGNASALADHYDGSSWSNVPVGTPTGGGFLTAVTCTAPGDCWAVGNATVIPQVPLIEHYDGKMWSIVSSTHLGTGNLSGVACSGRSDCWGVGLGYGTDLGAALIEHYDGTSWSAITTTALTGNPNLTGVVCLSAADCRAVGVASRSPAAFRFGGTAWMELTPGASAGPGALLSVACPSANTCWAVGYLGTKIGDPASTTLIEPFP